MWWKLKPTDSKYFYLKLSWNGWVNFIGPDSQMKWHFLMDTGIKSPIIIITMLLKKSPLYFSLLFLCVDFLTHSKHLVLELLNIFERPHEVWEFLKGIIPSKQLRTFQEEGGGMMALLPSPPVSWGYFCLFGFFFQAKKWKLYKTTTLSEASISVTNLADLSQILWSKECSFPGNAELLF